MMVSHISLRNSLLMLLCGLVFAAAAALLLNYTLKGPRLGFHFDFLLRYKKPVVSREILIINTGEYTDSGDVYSVLMTLTEMQASSLVLAAKMPSSSSPIIMTETDIKRRFSDEYLLLGSNIRNLFEGIRMGYVTPSAAPQMVEQVIDLAGHGRDRLISALIDRDENLLRAVTVFGNYIQADAVPVLDRDGKLRRVMPFDQTSEHPVYSYLKNRYALSRVETSGDSQILWLRSHDAKDIDIPLDSGGNIISAAGAGFRNIDIEMFREYEQALSVMRNLLERAHELKAFLFTAPQKIPLFLDEHAEFLLGELLAQPGSDNMYAWLSARSNYMTNLDDFVLSNAQELIVNYYDEQIAALDLLLDEDAQTAAIPSTVQQISELIKTINDTIDIFTQIRETYAELHPLYKTLKEELGLSFCIMGPYPDAQYTAHLANAVITGAHVKPVSERYILIFSFAAVFAVLLIIFYMRPFFLLIFGVFLSVICAAAFSLAFIIYSYWIDPLISLGSSLTGAAVIFFIKSAYLNYRARAFRMAYRTSVSKEVLKSLIILGRPRLSEINDAFSAVIAIKDTNLLGKEDHEKSRDKGKARRSFYAAAKKVIFSSGAVITGFEGDTILVCYGSPIDKSYHPVSKACNLVKELIKNDKITWRFGIDAGMCSYSWSHETGYCVNGRPAVRARVLVSKTVRYKKRALVSNNVLEKLHINSQEIGAFDDESGTFFELPN